MPDELHNWLLLIGFKRRDNAPPETDRSVSCRSNSRSRVFNSTSFSTGRRLSWECRASPKSSEGYLDTSTVSAVLRTVPFPRLAASKDPSFARGNARVSLVPLSFSTPSALQFLSSLRNNSRFVSGHRFTGAARAILSAMEIFRQSAAGRVGVIVLAECFEKKIKTNV